MSTVPPEPFASLAEAIERLERNGYAGVAEKVKTLADLADAADEVKAQGPVYEDSESRALPGRLRATSKIATTR